MIEAILALPLYAYAIVKVNETVTKMKSKLRFLGLNKLLKRSFYSITVFTVLFSGMAAMFISPVVSASTSRNTLLWVAQNCNGFTDLGSCQDAQNLMKDGNPGAGTPGLNCSGNLFYQPSLKDSNGATVKNKYYIDPQAYKDCYSKASGGVSDLQSQCGRVNNTQSNWQSCQALQNALVNVLGCDDHMFKSISSSDYELYGPALASCKTRLANVGDFKLTIINSSGQVATDSQPVKSTNAQAQGGAGGTQGTASKTLSCDTSLTGSLTWAICPIIDLLSGAVNVVDGWITDQLTINTNPIFCQTTGGSGKCDNAGNQTTASDYHKAWSSFRDIALGLMAIAGLTIVIAQALGGEVLDAYTIRKALPRLLIAAVGITLSWPLMLFLVDVSNALGLGIGHLIYAPFSNLSNNLSLGIGGGGGVANFFFGAAGLAGIGLAAIALAPIILSFLGTAALGVFLAITVLILRQIVIILLILLAPVAIVMYILPNTQRVYKMWWESFFKALLMFPMIAGLIAAGRVFSAVSLQNHTVLPQIIGFIAYFAPYFLIPLTFKFAGAAMSGLGNFAQQAHAGGFNALKQRRSNQMKQLGQDIKAGQASRWLGGAREGSFRDRYNKRLQRVGNIGAAGIRPSQWKENINQAVRAQDNKGTSKELLNDEALAGIRGNDTLTEALARNDFDIERTRADLASQKKIGQTKADQMISAYTVASRGLRAKGYSERAIQIGTVLSGLGASTAHTHSSDYDPDTGEYIGNANVASTIARLSNGDANLEAQMVAATMEATPERPEIMPSFTEGFDAVQNIKSASSKSPAERRDTIRDSAKALRQTAIRKKGINVLYGSGHTARHIAPEYEDMVSEKYIQQLPAQQRFEQAVQAAEASATAAAAAAVPGPRPLTKEASERYDKAYERAFNEPYDKALEELHANPEVDEYMQMVAEMVATQNNSGNLPLEKRPIIGSLISRNLGPGVTVQSEADRMRSNKWFQKYVHDFTYQQQQTAATAAAAAAAQAGARGAVPPPAAPLGGL